MRMLYGVQGTGNGHITRAIAITEAINEYDNVEIDVLLSGRPPEPVPLEVTSCSWRDGLTFVHEAGQVKVLKTVMKNNIFRMVSDIRSLEVKNYDLIVTDFEPVVSWAAKMRGRNTVGIGHQYAFFHDVPTRGGSFVNKLIMKQFAPAKTRVGLHWHHFDQPILPPIVDIDFNDRQDVQFNKVVVYLPFEDQAQVVSLLKKCPDYEFYIYSPELTDADEGHIHRRKTSRETFKQDLITSNAVICNTGFELISECLTLGIKIFTKPLAGQVEQLSNGAALDELNYATVADNLFLPSVEQWLKSRNAVRVTYPNVQQYLGKWLASGATESVEDMAEKMWRSVEVIRH